MEGPVLETDVLPGRECGSCNVCCVALTIDDEELQKAQGYRCHNAQRDGSCAIYARRPRTCREFNCGWRVLRFVKPTLRPDQSGVLIRLHVEKSSATEGEQFGIIVTLLDKSALRAEGLAETVAAAAAAGRPVYLGIPGPPGYTGGLARINEAVAHAVATKDKPGLLEVLRQARKTGLRGERTRVRLKPRDVRPVAADGSPAAMPTPADPSTRA